ncbi:MAG: phosphoribosylanthranilate isomerase [Bacteroidota bacterium]|nr:phosphoribosylanthranilate isomerase [Bacteroidota bacterium]
MKLKICGMRDPANILQVSALQPDYMGFIFYPPSPRFVTSLPAHLLAGIRKKGIEPVAVFVNETIQTIRHMVDDFSFSCVQLHGSESPEDCLWLKQQGLIVFKAISVSEPSDLERTKAYDDCCTYFLFDTKSAGFGGSGHLFDWKLLERYTGNTPFFLSGGIGPEDVPSIRSFSHPMMTGIDINSRFESAPCIKDVKLIQPFLTELRRNEK